MPPSPQQLRQHYELETRLARRILESTPNERPRVVRECYDELYRSIDFHDYFTLTAADLRHRGRVAALFAHLVGREHDVLDVGCGVGDRAAAIAAFGNRCVGADISEEILTLARQSHPQIRFAVADAVTLAEFPAHNFDVVLTSQLIEHLHPDDVARHCAAVARVLRPGGRYLFDTPTRLLGPSDVSLHFGDKVARGFHLKEWTYEELAVHLRRAGFGRLRSPWGRQTTLFEHPAWARRGMLPLSWKLPWERLATRVDRRGFSLLLNKLVRLAVLVEATLGASAHPALDDVDPDGGVERAALHGAP